MNRKMAVSFIAYSLFSTMLTCVGSNYTRTDLTLQVIFNCRGSDKKVMYSINDKKFTNERPFSDILDKGFAAYVVIPDNMQTHAPYICLVNSAGRTDFFVPKEDISHEDIITLDEYLKRGTFVVLERKDDDDDKSNSTLILVKGMLSEKELSTIYRISSIKNHRQQQIKEKQTPQVKKIDVQHTVDQKEQPTSDWNKNYVYVSVVVICGAIAAAYWRYPEALQSFFARFTSFDFSKMSGLQSVSKR